MFGCSCVGWILLVDVQKDWLPKVSLRRFSGRAIESVKEYLVQRQRPDATRCDLHFSAARGGLQGNGRDVPPLVIFPGFQFRRRGQ